ncbi:MAG TPA: hypothetical protein PLC15_24745 [Candidatus Obscuribacter sp.]|nr:tetratricopeptide repeat protein [Candidatus Obscuribacter sp.]MBK9277256.1 tetratricopeptide repeat protein [Candidatus Obscuribacter sp.]HMW92206.1 hypothetical protein [Candidatus Obscuribacter sp.]HMX47923.1 hypothetical protein [Candidatus Obscuribacter sp.]HNA75004.1 hypothetical protein [Candidatus Obscuribacter sp.]
MNCYRMLLPALSLIVVPVTLPMDESATYYGPGILAPVCSAHARPTLFVDPSPWELKHAFNSLMVLQGTAKGKAFNEAEKYLAQARSAGEDAGYIKMAESSLSISRRQFTLAEKQALQALSLDPHNSRFLAQMGRVQLMLDREEEAKKYFLAAIHCRNPNSDACLVALSGFESGDCLEEAYEAGKVMIKANPSPAGAYYRTARIARSLGKFEEGKELMVKAIHIDPARKEHWYTLAEMELGLKNWKGALAASDKVLQLSGKNDCREAIFVLPIKAKAYEGLGDYAGAVKQWSLALEKVPDTRPVLVRRAACYAKLGDKSAEKRDLAKVKIVDQGL